MSTLTIYKSSAGSGKTFRLTANYIELLLNGNVSHRKILAVTFTNKASGEMKSRIIKTLYLLSKGDEESSLIADGIMAGRVYDKKQLFEKAAFVLSTILNDYSSFYVGTIDKFFQIIIRSFARESGLQAGYNLELNNRRILVEAIDLMMYSLDSDEKLKNWLVQFAGNNITSGKDWNFLNEILNLGQEIFKEKYLETIGGIKAAQDQKDKIEEYRTLLSQVTSHFENTLSEIGNNALKCIREAGLSIEDFSYKESGVAGYFFRISTKSEFNPKLRAREALDQPDKWVKANNDRKDEIISIIQNHLNPLLGKAIHYYDDKSIDYLTARTILKNLFTYRILTDIYLKVREITNEQNIFLLSDATVFLKRIIAGNDAPFIYEKAGNYFNHYMLDEFQDTSRYQWNNFHPLIINGLASGYPSLIVGDVKQAIYRWRNSDWKILASEAENEFPGFDVNIETLDTNWRSFRNIIAFNNSLFSASAAILIRKIEQEAKDAIPNEAFFNQWKEIICSIYKSSIQKTSPKNQNSKGYVEVSFHKQERTAYHKMLTDELPVLIRDILKRGYKQSDIAILVRKGKQGRDIADILMKYSQSAPEEERLNIISNDSLYIENHSSVRFLIALLKNLKNPSDPLNNAFVRHEFIRYLLPEKNINENADNIFKDCELGIISGINKYFDDYIQETDNLKRLPLFELTEELIRLFGLNLDSENIAYLQAFQDLVLDFVRNQTADISSFLSWWEQNGSNKTLTVSEVQDAIKIMTIHKSKGLQFPVVIVPFVDWKLDAEKVNSTFLWCENCISPFDYIENVPVIYSKALTGTHFQFNYLDEKFRNYADNLNLLYVALTRPEEELYIFANLDKNDTAAHIINEIIISDSTPSAETNEYPVLKLNHYFNSTENKFIKGSKSVLEQKSVNVLPEFLMEYPIGSGIDRLQLNIKNAWLINNENDYHEKIGYGTIMHKILSGIETTEDIDRSVKKAVNRGEIPVKDYSSILSFLSRAINSPQTNGWFDGSWKLMRERELKGVNNKIQRPDRVLIKDEKLVLIDYKFGNETSQIHEKQVRNYSETLKNIGYRDIRAYLWYLTAGKVIEIK